MRESYDIWPKGFISFIFRLSTGNKAFKASIAIRLITQEANYSQNCVMHKPVLDWGKCCLPSLSSVGIAIGMRLEAEAAMSSRVIPTRIWRTVFATSLSDPAAIIATIASKAACLLEVSAVGSAICWIWGDLRGILISKFISSYSLRLKTRFKKHLDPFAAFVVMSTPAGQDTIEICLCAR